MYRRPLALFRFTLLESVKKPSVDPLRKIHVTIEVSHVPTITPTAHPTRARALCELNGAFALCRSESGWQIQCTSGFYKHHEGHTGWPSRPDGGRASTSLLAQLGLQEDFVSVECSLHEAS